MKARVANLVRNTLSRPVLYNCKYHDSITKSYGADIKLHLKQSRGNNSDSMKAKVAILVHDTSPRPVLDNCTVS